MKKAKLITTKEANMFIKGRGLPKGCKLCLKGQKAVLFLNGICQKPNICFWYCPISSERRGKDVTFANEIEITSKEDLLEEINKIDAKGMSITGGEPLSGLNLEKTLEYMVDFIEGIYRAREGPGVNPKEEFAEQLAELKEWCEQHRDSQHEKTRQLAREFLNDWQAIWTVLEYPHLPITNNIAERALRHWVIARKISYGTRTKQGSRAFALLAV